MQINSHILYRVMQDCYILKVMLPNAALRTLDEQLNIGSTGQTLWQAFTEGTQLVWCQINQL